MNESLTAVIERNTTFAGEFTSEPYEVAWAREARWFFVPLASLDAPTKFTMITEVSPDGLVWCPLSSEAISVDAREVTSWPVREFGGWLRVRGTISGSAEVRGSLYLALKE